MWECLGVCAKARNSMLDTKKRRKIYDVIYVKTIQQRVKKIKLKFLIIFKTKIFSRLGFVIPRKRYAIRFHSRFRTFHFHWTKFWWICTFAVSFHRDFSLEFFLATISRRSKFFYTQIMLKLRSGAYVQFPIDVISFFDS